ncbi:MAG TPA: Flp pilus assembly protein CpaB [Thermoguttaceae bacterium]|nr:Flp pilus assembly protein CpaB [Thermoguttaceae bacterium]
MRAKSFALLILALGCGLVASIAVTQVLAKKDAGPVAPSADEVSVFVAMEDIGFAEPLTSQVLKIEPWPKGKIPAGALTKIEDIEGRKTRTKLFAGEPILENKLFPKGKNAAGVAELIPRGYRAIPVSVDSVSGGSGMIRPGDRVDVTVYVQRNPAQGIQETGIQDVLQDIKVFAVNNVVDIETESATGKQMSAKTISLLVTPNDAKKLMLATELGSVRLMMRGAGGEDTYSEEMVGYNDFFGQAEDESDPNAETTSKSGSGTFLDMLEDKAKTIASSAGVRPAKDNAVRRTMRIVRGEVIEDVTLELDETHADEGSNRSERWRVADSQITGNMALVASPVEMMPPAAVPVEPSSDPKDDPQQDKPNVEGN